MQNIRNTFANYKSNCLTLSEVLTYNMVNFTRLIAVIGGLWFLHFPVVCQLLDIDTILINSTPLINFTVDVEINLISDKEFAVKIINPF